MSQEPSRVEKFKYNKHQYKVLRWHHNGKLHREDGPAEIWYEDDYMIYAGWHWNGPLHREDGPASVHFERNGAKYEFWYINGEAKQTN